MAQEETTQGEHRDMAASLALGAASQTRADAFLEEQTRLTRLQIAEFEEDNALRRRLLKLEHSSAAMKFALEIAATIIVTALAIALAAAVWSAAHDNGLVVEPFSVPPDLAQRGLTGEVVAARLLDRLSALQAQTASNRAASSYANNWGSDIKVQIPDTGVSIGEFNRALRAWLGHETHISGEIYRTPTGIAVTARAGGDSSPTLTGTDADLDALIQKAAESVYRATQPYRYAVYLMNANRVAEAEAEYNKLIVSGSTQDRAWAYVGLANLYQSRGDFDDALRVLQSAQELRPDFIMVYFNVASIQSQLQHDEQALAAAEKSGELLRRGTDPDVNDRSKSTTILFGQAAYAGALGDFAGQIAFDRQLEALPEFNGQVENARGNDTVAYAFLHDRAGVRRTIFGLPPVTDPQVLLSRSGNQAFADLLLGNPSTLLSQRAMFEDKLSKIGIAGTVSEARQFWPVVAYALALSGDLPGAHEVIDKTPTDCVTCLRMRGRIAALEKKWPAADYWFARAAHDAPSIPFAFTDWGAMLLEKGEFDAAIAKFALAHEKGPHFADPLEMWGEALIAKNHSDLALAKFEEADKYALNWGRLHLKWGEALLWSGNADKAREQFAIAAKLDLSAADRATLAGIAHKP
jgi:tetratricopeptide (TPR) repeat protein